MKQKKNAHAFSKNKGFKVLGIGKQDAIKYFFGGNAIFSIFALILITVFLAKEALFFFPDYQTNLNIYRKSGKEFADFADNQLDYQKGVKSLTTRLKTYEIIKRAGIDIYIPELYLAMKIQAEEKMKAELLAIKIAKERISSREMIWEFWMDDPEKKDLAIAQKKEYEEKLVNAQAALNDKIAIVAPEIAISDLSAEFREQAYKVNELDPTVHGKLQDALISYYATIGSDPEEPEFVVKSAAAGKAARERISQEPFFKNLSKQEAIIQKWIPDEGNSNDFETFGMLVKKLRTHSLRVSNRSESYLTAGDRKKAIEEGIPLATEERRKELETKLQRLVTEEQDYEAEANKIKSYLPKHKELMDAMSADTEAALAALPPQDEFSDEDAKNFHKDLMEAKKEYADFMEDQRAKMEAWDFSKQVGGVKTFFGFFFGTTWVANSSWHNFFGLVPLFGGSFFITIIAISIATPFSVGSAIYVNRIATPAEQNFLKPIIEFIGAIPSVVLAFIGVVVVGKLILNLSYIPWLSWVSGFPAQGEQMMLTAGILLAFMAIPTMFTLAEDAINNVPKSFNEASLALGATKLQTVFKVIVPCAISGVVAAVLLGFGRIIGETMVVLLVAGGTIAWPETWTSPVHTMTGIIAQSTGEAAPGSIQYRALFLVGLVLFFISLILNSLAQNVIKKLGNK